MVVWSRCLQREACGFFVMPFAPARPCLAPGCPALVARDARCPRHQYRARGTRHQQGYDNDWLRLSKATIAAQPWCSLCLATSDLTADHVVPLSRGGKSEPGNVRVLCRSCNSRRGNRA